MGNAIIISWTPLDNIYLTSYIIKYRKVYRLSFREIELPSLVSLVGLTNLEEQKEYIFEIFCVLIINNVKYNGPISSPVTVQIPGPTMPSITETLSCPTHILVSSFLPKESSLESTVGSSLLVGILLLAVIVVILLVILTICTGLAVYHCKRKTYNNHK